MLGNVSPVKDSQSFVEGDPYQPIPESALAIKGCGVTRGRDQTIFDSSIGHVRIAKHAVCDKMEQTSISRYSSMKRHAVVRRNLSDRNTFVQLYLQVQCGLHFPLLLPKLVLRVIWFALLSSAGNRTLDTTFYSTAVFAIRLRLVSGQRP
jgi:hypothetical protein